MARICMCFKMCVPHLHPYILWLAVYLQFQFSLSVTFSWSFNSFMSMDRTINNWTLPYGFNFKTLKPTFTWLLHHLGRITSAVGSTAGRVQQECPLSNSWQPQSSRWHHLLLNGHCRTSESIHSNLLLYGPGRSSIGCSVAHLLARLPSPESDKDVEGTVKLW